jgi:hypothetical protein
MRCKNISDILIGRRGRLALIQRVLGNDSVVCPISKTMHSEFTMCITEDYHTYEVKMAARLKYQTRNKIFFWLD